MFNKNNYNSLLSFDDEIKSSKSDIKDSSDKNRNFIKSGSASIQALKEKLKLNNQIKKQSNSFSILEVPYLNSSNVISKENSHFPNFSSSDFFKPTSISKFIENKDELEDKKYLTAHESIISSKNENILEQELLNGVEKSISELDQLYALFYYIDEIKSEMLATKYIGYNKYSYSNDFPFIIKISELKTVISSCKNAYIKDPNGNISTIKSKLKDYDNMKTQIQEIFIKIITFINDLVAEIDHNIINPNCTKHQFTPIDSNSLTTIAVLKNTDPKHLVEKLLYNQSTYKDQARFAYNFFKKYYPASSKIPIECSSTSAIISETEKQVDNSYLNPLKTDREESVPGEQQIFIPRKKQKKIEEDRNTLIMDTKILQSFVSRLEHIPEMRRWSDSNKNDLNIIICTIESKQDITMEIICIKNKILTSLEEAIEKYLTKAKEIISKTKTNQYTALTQMICDKITNIKFDGSIVYDLESYVSLMESYIKLNSNGNTLINSNSNKSILFKHKTISLSDNNTTSQQISYKNKSHKPNNPSYKKSS